MGKNTVLNNSCRVRPEHHGSLNLLNYFLEKRIFWTLNSLGHKQKLHFLSKSHPSYLLNLCTLFFSFLDHLGRLSEYFEIGFSGVLFLRTAFLVSCTGACFFEGTSTGGKIIAILAFENGWVGVQTPPRGGKGGVRTSTPHTSKPKNSNTLGAPAGGEGHTVSSTSWGHWFSSVVPSRPKMFVTTHR